MAKQLVQDEIWTDRFKDANREYEEWENLFKCDTLENYYEGFQWRNTGDSNVRPYTINKVFETIAIKIAQFVPTFPKFEVSPRPVDEWDLETASQGAQIKQDTLNNHIRNTKAHFSEEIELAYTDSFFRFAVMEVGYAADWIQNPNAPRPLYNSGVDKKTQGKNSWKVRQEPSVLPNNERVYFKHIPGKRFRVGGINNKYLDRCGWVGYYEWVEKEDLLSLKIMNRKKVEALGDTTPEKFMGMDRENEAVRDGIKIWRVWDLAAMNQLIIVDDPVITVFQRRFERLPLFDYRPTRRAKGIVADGFYPIPPVWNWLSPQDEINETREMLRNHRRRFVRKFSIVEGMIEDVELEKFETGPDGSLVKVKRENAIQAIANAPHDPSLSEALVTSADDLNKISGTSSEVRGTSDRTTATQAQIINQRSGLRESADRDKITRWLVAIGREALLITRDKFTLPMWIKMSGEQQPPTLGQVQDIQPGFRRIMAEDLKDDYDFDIDVDVTSLSANIQQEEKKKFLEFLSILAQFPAISFSPTLVQEAAYRCGYRNMKAIKEMQNMAMLMEMGRMLQMKAQVGALAGAEGGGGVQEGQAPQQIVQQQTPPDSEEIRNQMAQQLGQLQ